MQGPNASETGSETAETGSEASETAPRLAGQDLVLEFYRRVDDRDVDGAAALYADDAVFLGAEGRAAIREVMIRGLAPNADRRTRHVIANLRSSAADDGAVHVSYTALALTLDGPGPYAARTVLDQVMRLRAQPDGSLRISGHEIAGFVVPPPP